MIETFEDRFDANYDDLRYEYEEMLIDSGRYSKLTAEHTSDGWDEFCQQAFLDR